MMTTAEGDKGARKPATTSGFRRKIVQAGADESAPERIPQPPTSAAVAISSGCFQSQADIAKSIYPETFLPMQSEGAASKARVAPYNHRPVLELQRSGTQIHSSFSPPAKVGLRTSKSHFAPPAPVANLQQSPKRTSCDDDSMNSVAAPYAASGSAYRFSRTRPEKNAQQRGSSNLPPYPKRIKLDGNNIAHTARVTFHPAQALLTQPQGRSQQEATSAESDSDDEPIIASARNYKYSSPPHGVASGLSSHARSYAGFRHTAQAAICSERSHSITAMPARLPADTEGRQYPSQPRPSIPAAQAVQGVSASAMETRSVPTPVQFINTIVSEETESDTDTEDFPDGISPPGKVVYFDELCPAAIPFRCETCYGMQGYHYHWCWHKPIDWENL